MRLETIKILEDSIGSNFSHFGHSNFFLEETKANINYWNYIKMKSFCTAKEIINKTERQPPEWEKIFANDITN